MSCLYQISGDEERQYDMCGHRTETITGQAHLMARKTSSSLYSRCQCLLLAENNSVVAVTLKDIRLYSSDISQRKCSTSVLKINENAFECNATSIALGSVFNGDLPTMAPTDTLKVTIDIEDPVFDMVWLIAETQGMVYMTNYSRLTKVFVMFGKLHRLTCIFTFARKLIKLNLLLLVNVF